MNYEESRQYIEEAQKYKIVLGLGNMQEMQRRLGDPQNKVPYVHIAGTNGKGSLAAYLFTCLKEAGYHVGRYTSPTLYSYRERLQTEEGNITKEDFAICTTKVAAAITSMTQEGLPHPTPFEIETAIAFEYFYMKKCQIVLLEVGMGGESDATNIIDHSLVDVLVSISMDHQAFLGNTLSEIASVKAGIIKPGAAVVSSPQTDEVRTVIEEACRKNHADLTITDLSQVQVTSETIRGQTFLYQGEEYQIALAGHCQTENALCALHVLEQLDKKGFPTSLEQKKKGLAGTVWNGRFTVLQEEPMVIVDGAHNPGAAVELEKSIRQYFPGKKLIYIMGVFRDKDYRTVIRTTVPHASKVLTIQTPQNPRALPAEELALAVKEIAPWIPVQPMETIEAAIEAALGEAKPEDVILAFGSLSFIGDFTGIISERNRKKTKSMNQLEEYREKIDRIDSEIVRLFEERMLVAGDIARYKISAGRPVLDRQREQQKIEALRAKASGSFNQASIEELFTLIMEISRRRQTQIIEADHSKDVNS